MRSPPQSSAFGRSAVGRAPTRAGAFRIDSSFEARKELAVELGGPPELMKDSAQMNMWLHKTVLARIAANGGNVPANLLD